MAMPSPTGTTVVSTPKSRVATNGISTVGLIPSRFTATSTKTAAMRNWPISFALGVSPSDRSWATFEASSMSPRMPVATVAPSRSHSSAVGAPTEASKVKTMTAMSMMTPPIVGVPCFTRWLWGPSARTCWPMWLVFRKRIQAGMSTMVITMAMATPRKIMNVG